MSVQQSSLVWQYSKSKHSARLVALAIADFCDDRGRAFPAISTLARKCVLSPRAVQEAIRELQALGELRIEMNTGPHGVNTYFLAVTPANFAPLPPQTLHPPQTLRPAKTVRTPRKLCRGGVQISSLPPANFAPDPSGSVIDPSGSVKVQDHIPDVLGVEADFLEAWEAFIGHRKKIRKPMSPRAEGLILKRLAERPGEAVAAIDAALEKGWQSFEWEWIDNLKPKKGVDYMPQPEGGF